MGELILFTTPDLDDSEGSLHVEPAQPYRDVCLATSSANAADLDGKSEA